MLTLPLAMVSLFSGIGGLELGLERAGLARTLAQVEQDEFCCAVLARHWPDVDRGVRDVRHADAATLPACDIICGGFPCQDVSSAGRGDGLTGERSGLWSEFRRVVADIRPALTIVENVASGARRWLPQVRRDLHVLGYATDARLLSSFDVGAPHRRKRVFLLAADTERFGLRQQSRGWGRPVRLDSPEPVNAGASWTPRDTDGEGQPQPAWAERYKWRWSRDAGRWTIEPPVCGVAHGISRRVDRNRALGNAVNPACAEAFGRAVVAFLAPFLTEAT